MRVQAVSYLDDRRMDKGKTGLRGFKNTVQVVHVFEIETCGFDHTAFFLHFLKCNATCGLGVRKRPYWCDVEGKAVDARYCATEAVPKFLDSCFLKKCTDWYAGKWDQVRKLKEYS